MTGRLPRKLYRIGEVIEHTGLSRQTLHLYTTMGLITPAQRTSSGYRLYPPAVFRALEKVSALKAKGYTLGQIRERLQKHATRSKAAKTARQNRTAETADRRNTSLGGRAT